jgi:predicted DNA-binding transcriptional regulator AlpA
LSSDIAPRPWLQEPTPVVVEIISKRRTKELTSLSERQQDRLEALGLFPQSIKLGVGKNARTGRALHEVLAWNRWKLAQRDARASSAVSDQLTIIR